VTLGTRHFLTARSKLRVIALTCLFTFALLALAVAYGRGPYGFEQPAFKWLGSPSTVGAWDNVAEFLTAPAIGVALAVSAVFGIVRRAFLPIVVYAAFAVMALLISEHVAKPLVQRSYYGELTFPSGSVTAVSATALAMWLALYPLLGKRARNIALVIGVAWTLLVALAVVGALWHTPLDALGSILLSTGVVAGGAAVFGKIADRRAPSALAGLTRPIFRQRADQPVRGVVQIERSSGARASSGRSPSTGQKSSTPAPHT
jgi:membrane-associated phospholipid phosphatase